MSPGEGCAREAEPLSGLEAESSGACPEAGSGGRAGRSQAFFCAAGSVEKRRGLGQPGCGEAAARGASGAGGSGARSEDAAARQTNPRSHQPGVSALEFDIHLSRVYPPPFFLNILKNRILFRFNLFLLPIPRLNRADRLERLLLYSPKSLRILETSREKKEAARAPERSRGRERDRVRERARASE